MQCQLLTSYTIFCSIRCHNYYLFCHAILCGYYLREAFIKLRGIATAIDTEIEEPDPFTNIDEDERGEQSYSRRLLVLCFLLSLNLNNICFVTNYEVLFTCAHAT